MPSVWTLSTLVVVHVFGAWVSMHALVRSQKPEWHVYEIRKNTSLAAYPLTMVQAFLWELTLAVVATVYVAWGVGVLLGSERVVRSSVRARRRVFRQCSDRASLSE